MPPRLPISRKYIVYTRFGILPMRLYYVIMIITRLVYIIIQYFFFILTIRDRTLRVCYTSVTVKVLVGKFDYRSLGGVV